MLACCGGESAGFTFFIKDARLHWEHNWFKKSRYRVSSKDKIPAGKRILSAEITVDKENAVGGGGKVTLRMGEKVIGEGRFAKQVPFRFTVQESFDIGCDTVTPVSDQYETPFRFTGQIDRVVVDVSEKAFEELATEAKAAIGKIAMGTQ